MNPTRIALAMIVALTLAGVASSTVVAQGEPVTEFSLIARNPDFAWLDPESGEVNPTITVPAGAEITVTITNDEMGGFHAFAVDGQQSEDILEAGQSTTFTFTAPESDTEYICPYHSTMVGTLQVVSADGTTTGGDTGTTGGDANATTGDDGATGGDGTTGGDADEATGPDATPTPGLVAALMAVGIAALVFGRRLRRSG